MIPHFVRSSRASGSWRIQLREGTPRPPCAVLLVLILLASSAHAETARPGQVRGVADGILRVTDPSGAQAGLLVQLAARQGRLQRQESGAWRLTQPLGFDSDPVGLPLHVRGSRILDALIREDRTLPLLLGIHVLHAEPGPAPAGRDRATGQVRAQGALDLAGRRVPIALTGSFVRRDQGFYREQDPVPVLLLTLAGEVSRADLAIGGEGVIGFELHLVCAVATDP